MLCSWDERLHVSRSRVLDLFVFAGKWFVWLYAFVLGLCGAVAQQGCARVRASLRKGREMVRLMAGGTDAMSYRLD